MIDERSGMGAIGDMNAYMQFKAAQSISDAAKQEGGAAGQGMGLGLGLGYGQMMAGAVGGAHSQGSGAAQTVACAKCGTQNPAGAKFCSSCGAAQQAPGAASVECPSCHAQVQAGTKFCSSCGHSLVPQQCKNCQSALQPGAKFCASCGTAV